MDRNLWYWLAQIIGALAFGFFLDNHKMKRKTRAVCGLAILFVVINSIVRPSLPPLLPRPKEEMLMGATKWGGGVEPLLGSSRTKYDNNQAPGIDIFGNPSPLHSPRKRRLTGGADKDYTWYLLLYMAYGLLDAVPLPPPSLFCFLFFFPY